MQRWVKFVKYLPEYGIEPIILTVDPEYASYPVVDESNEFYGTITLDEIKHIMFKPELYDKYKVEDLMFIPVAKVDPEESMEEVAQKFSTSGYYNIPVIKNGKYWGFVSRANVFSAYRKLLKDFSDD